MTTVEKTVGMCVLLLRVQTLFTLLLSVFARLCAVMKLPCATPFGSDDEGRIDWPARRQAHRLVRWVILGGFPIGTLS